MQQDLKYYVTENSRKIYDTLFPIQQWRLTAAATNIRMIFLQDSNIL